ncbi:hypothetical protein [Paenibacillus sp. Marseille-Q4541]|uniref:hypothetical protein n=1 Tax=Paenibacillus sp. Marseille-Q4541 TaxID=2831522 RepID=UPI001BADB38D|nr:hypothetical protein [Paenibacillus sp. Marseille-Q4541]
MKCQACGKTVKDVLEHVEHILHECGKVSAASPNLSSVPPDAMHQGMKFSGSI